MDVERGHDHVMQSGQSLKDSTLPRHIRLDFVKKVYSLLIAMLLVSFGIAAPFVFSTASTMSFMQGHSWILFACMAFLALNNAVNIAMGLEACCGGGACTETYFRMMKTVPYNYVFLFLYATCFGFVIGGICTQYNAASVCLVFAITAGLMTALTIYAITTEQDFTGMGMYLCAFSFGLAILGLIAMFMPYGSFIHKLIAVGGAVLFSFVIIYDTQLIFGTAPFSMENSVVRKTEFTIDMYAFAAYQLYLDFVNMFLYLLQLFAERRND